MSGFTALVTEDDGVPVMRGGHTVAVLAGAVAERRARGLSIAADEDARQLLLARATGSFKRGNER